MRCNKRNELIIHDKITYLSGWMADNTNIRITMSKLSGSKGVAHDSWVTSRTNALHLKS